MKVRRDWELESQIQRVWDGNFQVYGVRKTWRPLIKIGRCTVARLIARLGPPGVLRGRRFKTTVADPSLAPPGGPGRAQLLGGALRRAVGLGSDLRYAQPTTPARMGVELLEHVWNA